MKTQKRQEIQNKQFILKENESIIVLPESKEASPVYIICKNKKLFIKLLDSNIKKATH